MEPTTGNERPYGWNSAVPRQARVVHIRKTPVPRTEVEADVVVLETPVRKLRVKAELLLSHVLQQPPSIEPKSTVETILAPPGSRFSAELTFEEGRWLPPERDTSPVPANTYCEHGGLTLWHQIALGYYRTLFVEKFLAKAVDIAEARVRRDLWEFSGPLPVVEPWMEPEAQHTRVNPFLARLLALPERDRIRLFRHRTPVELSLLLGKPLFGGCEELTDGTPLPRPVLEAKAWSQHLLEAMRRHFAPHLSKEPF